MNDEEGFKIWFRKKTIAFNSFIGVEGLMNNVSVTDEEQNGWEGAYVNDGRTEANNLRCQSLLPATIASSWFARLIIDNEHPIGTDI